jgi:hypothetical protein
MTLVQVVEDTTMLVPGFEHHTWQCSGCSVLEQRMRFSRAKILDRAAAAKPVRTAGTDQLGLPQSAPLQVTQPPPAKPQSVPVEPTQTVPVQGVPPTPPVAKRQTNAWAAKLRKVQERAAAAEETASEIERRAEFNRFWDTLLLVPSPTIPSGQSADELVRSPAKRSSSHERSTLGSKP